MGITELNLELTAEQKTTRDEARKFLLEVWRPASIELDRLSDPADVIALLDDIGSPATVASAGSRYFFP